LSLKRAYQSGFTRDLLKFTMHVDSSWLSLVKNAGGREVESVNPGDHETISAEDTDTPVSMILDAIATDVIQRRMCIGRPAKPILPGWTLTSGKSICQCFPDLLNREARSE
jgi:hypothetical protein